MREFTKAAISYGWSTTVFQMQQLMNVLAGAGGEGSSATAAFNAMTECTVQQLGPTMRATYRAGDAMQRGMVNLAFGSIGLGGGDCGARRRSDGPLSAGADDQSSSFGSPNRPVWSAGPRSGRPSWRDLRRAPAGGAWQPDDAEIGGVAEPQGWGPMP